MAATPFSPATDDRLAAPAAEAVRFKVGRGACWVALATLASLAALLLLDGLLELSLTARCLLQLLWLAGAILLTWRLVIQPWQEEDPGVGERPAAPLVAATSAAWLAAVGVALAVPGSGERLQRIVVPWYREIVVAPYQIVVTSGDATVRRGGPVTLAAYAEPMSPGAALPGEAVAFVRDANGGNERIVPMNFDGAAAFHVTLDAVPTDFDYRIEAGAAKSPWHTVRVADAVETAATSTAVITPPPYAAAAVAARTQAALAPIEALQYSTASFRLRFTRPASTAALEWRSEGRAKDFELTAVELSPDRTEGTAEFRLVESGTLVLVLVNETGSGKLRTETPIRVQVRSDAPPRFTQIAGMTVRSRQVRPGERLPIAVAVADDVGIDGAALEYVAPGAKEPVVLPIPLSQAAGTAVEGRVVLDLGGKAKEGETIRLRLRVRDNRRIDPAKLRPQEAIYPPSGWEELVLTGSPPPLDRQEIFIRRDTIRDGLLKSHGEVKQAVEDVRSLRADTAGRSPLPIDHAVRLRAARERGRKAIDQILESAREADLAFGLDTLVAALRDIADRQLPEANSGLARAATDNPADRDAALASAVAHFAIALERIEAAVGRNDRLAQDLLDRSRLAALATDQQALADSASPPAGKPREELLRRQQEHLDRLNRLVAESGALSRGTQAAAGREAAALAAEATALAGLVRELDAAADRLTADLRRALLDDLVRADKDLADRAVVVIKESGTAARLVRTNLPSPDDFRRVAELIAADKLVDAMIEMEKLARTLDATAAAFDSWCDEESDAKLVARHLARWQDDLRGRFAAATNGMPFLQLPEPIRAAFFTEQTALLRSAERLQVPAGTEIGALRETATVHLRLAAKNLGADGAAAGPAMSLATEALTRLAEKLPPTAERLAKSLPELRDLRGEQDSIITAAETVLRQYEKEIPDAGLRQTISKRLAPVAAREEKLVSTLAALDLPGLEPRMKRCRAAIATAASDLKSGAPYDAAASLAAARRELEWLEAAADRRTTTDETAETLARLQREIADGVAALGNPPNPDELAALAANQGNLVRQVANLAAPEAATLLAEAREAVAAVEAGFGDRLGPDELTRQAKLAEAALAKLADRMNGREPARELVRRLAARRRAAVDQARNLAGKPYNPNASSRENRRLRHEVEELHLTRVGANGQPIKKRVLDLYARLLAKTEPDRDVATLKQLADTLDELVAAMKDDAELATATNAILDEGADRAGAFAPSQAKVDALRDLGRRQRALRQSANEVEGEVAKRTRPAMDNALARLEQRQRILTEAIEGAARSLVAGGDARTAEEVDRAAEAARQAGYRLKFGQARLARDSGEIAARRLRAVAAAVPSRARKIEELVVRQEALLADLTGVLESPAVAAAQLVSQHETLAARAAELADTMELAAARHLPGDPLARALEEAAKLARSAEKRLTQAAELARKGKPADADRLRTEAAQILEEASKKTVAAVDGNAGSGPMPEIGSGEEVRRAEMAMRRAVALLSGGDLDAAQRSMRQAKEALDRAVEAISRRLKPVRDAGP
jgi:hypothetical protein